VEEDRKLIIPFKYANFENLFRKKKNKEALLKYQLQNHKIPLIKGKTSTALLIYSLSEKKLKTLREYIDKNLIKRYIKCSKLFIRYTVLFVSKKDGKLRIYVDYKKLNDIIIKNRYTLSLIHEI
jgi:hypothetical protein